MDAVGEGVQGWNKGDEVVLLPGVSCGACARCQAGDDQLCSQYEILGESRDGTAAEFVLTTPANLASKPAGLSMAEAASIALVFQTAWHMLVARAGLRAGETVLVQAGMSGVGSAAIQIARMLGATVLTTAGTDEKCARAVDLGAHHAINYVENDFVAAVRGTVGRAGVDVVVEHVGEATFAGSMKCLGRAGRLVTCGATTGGAVQLSLHHLFFKSQSVLGSTMGSKGDLRRILQFFDDGRLRPVLDRALPLEKAAEAHRLLEERQAIGKVVLEP